MKALAFLTLVLGLVQGPVEMELSVPAAAAAVELRLDGETRARLEGPPWRATVDVGEELAPHRLEAVAFDAGGRELDRVEQWLNVPRPPAELRLVVEPAGEEAAGSVARLSWQAVVGGPARRIAVTLDGEPLPVEDPSAIPLPPLRPGGGHVLSAEVTFTRDVVARADLALGGGFGDAVDSRLTSLAVEVDRERRKVDAGEASGWLRSSGGPLVVRTVESGTADLWFVLDHGARDHLHAIGEVFARRLGARGRPHVDAGRPDLYTVMAPVSSSHPLRSVGSKPEDRVFLVRPTADAGTQGYRLFPPLLLEGGEDRGTAWRLAHLRFPIGERAPQRLGDALAAAGLGAAGSGRPRAAVLILSPGFEDHGVIGLDEARRFLARLGVPVRVWIVGVEGRDGDAGPASPHLPSGPGVRRIGRLSEWLDAHRELRESLERQRILWVEGQHLPQDVEPAPGAPRWISLVGSGSG